MANDLYIFNATAQIFDTTSTIQELITRTNKLVPPGAQAHLVLTDPVSLSKVTAQHETCGVQNLGTAVSPSYKGLSHNGSPVTVNGKVPLVV